MLFKIMNKKKLGFWFQVPAIVLVVVSFLASVYVKIAGSYPVGWATPITLGIITILYFLGKKYEKSNDFSF